jgi:hypothetical protein
MKTKTPKPSHSSIIRNLLAGLLVGGLLALPARVFAEPNEEYSVTKVANEPGCCFEFELDCVYGGDDVIDYVLVTVSPNTVTVAGASGPGSTPPTVTPTQIKYYTIGGNLIQGTPQYVEACFDNIPRAGATVTFTAHSTIDGGYTFGIGSVSVTSSAECAIPSCLQIACQANIVTSCTYPDGALVVFPMPTVTSTCSCGNQPTILASWPSGTGNQTASGSPVAGIFPIGVTPVTITASDGCGDSNTCTFSVTVTGESSPPAGAWAFSDGNYATNGTCEGFSVAVDGNGNEFVAGTFTGSATFTGRLPMYPSVNNGQPIRLYAGGGTNGDAFVAKYDTTGYLLWATNTESCGGIGARGVAVDSAGNCFVTGAFEGCAFPNYQSDYCGDYGLYPFGTEDMFLAKYDPQGNLLWALNAGDSVNQVGNTTGSGVAVDSAGNCYVTGGYSQSLGFGNNLNPCYPGSYFPPASLLGQGSGDAYVAKYDPAGSFLWAAGSTCPPTNASASSRSVAVETLGGTTYAWMVGIFTGENVKFGTLPGLSTTPAGYGNAFVVKYTDNGNSGTADWAQQTSSQTTCATCDPATGSQDGRGIGVDASGNCYFSAYFNGSVTIGSLPPVTDPNSQSGSYGFTANQLYDYLVGSFSPTGTARWIINGGQPMDNESRGLAVSAAGTVFLAGEYGASGQFFSGGQEVMLNEYDANGAQLLSETGVAFSQDTAEITAGWGVAVDAAGCFYATGGFDDPGNNPPSDPGLVFPYFPSQEALAAPGGLTSMFLVKYCPVCEGGVAGCVVPPGNLVLWLPFDETSGSTSANIAPVVSKNNGTQVGGPTVVLGSYVDNSLSFNGSQYVSVPDYAAIDPASTQGFTLDAWVNRGTTGPNTPPCVVLDKRVAASGFGYGLSVDYGHVFITLSGDNYDSSPSVVPADGQWHFIAVTVLPGSPGQGEFYIDGNAPVPFTPTAADTATLVTSAPFLVGTSTAGGNQPWQGGIDEVEMFGRALAASEIKGIFDAGSAGKCKTPATETYQVALAAGVNSIANQLDNGNNSLNEIMPVVPDGSVLYKYVNNGANSTWISSTYSAAAGQWLNGNTISLNPGEGAFFQSPTNFTLTFRGTVHVPVLPVSLPSGSCYLLSRQTNDMGTYTNIVGTSPVNKTKFIQWNPSSQGYTTAVFESGTWTIGGAAGPTVPVGQAVWISNGGALPPIPQNVTYEGMTSIAQGNASVTVSDGELVVSNLTSGGQDGVTISLPGSVAGLIVSYQALDVSNTLPVGADLEEQIFGTAGPVTDGLLGAVTVTKAGTTNYAISADFSPVGATNYTVQAYRDGVLVGQANGGNGSSQVGTAIWPPAGDLYDPLFNMGNLEADWLSLFWPTPVPLYMGGAWVTATHLVFAPGNVTMSGPPTAFQITGSQVPALTISNETLTAAYAGLQPTALGNATLMVTSSSLVVSNLSSSGQDGVAISIPPAVTGMAMQFAPLEVSSLPVGAYVRSQVIGTGAGISNGVLGTVTTTVTGSTNFSILPDFSPVGATTYSMKGYSQGALVAQATGLTGPLGGAGIALPGPDWNWNVSGPGGVVIGSYSASTFCFDCQWWVYWYSDFAVVDHVEITPDNVTTATTPTTWKVTASQVPALNVTGFSVSPLNVNMRPANHGAVLNWYGTGILQTSPSLNSTNPWPTLINSVSPFQVPFGPGNMFYRIMQPTGN